MKEFERQLGKSMVYTFIGMIAGWCLWALLVGAVVTMALIFRVQIEPSLDWHSVRTAMVVAVIAGGSVGLFFAFLTPKATEELSQPSEPEQ
ncbi:MAG: hypothetical protein ABI758_00015 [Candidatus Woesebacteria bacterium]